MTVLPAILATSAEEFRDKLELVRPFAPLVHIDVMDGLFVPSTTWTPPLDKIGAWLGEMGFEAHLMVKNPHELAPAWLAAGASRAIFHAEATEDEQGLCAALGEDCAKLMIAINPDTAFTRLLPSLEAFSQFMLMGVPPGKGGQTFQDDVLEKISRLREARHDAVISVDGGVTLEKAAKIAGAGASTLVAGSAIFQSGDPREAYEALVRAGK